MRDDELRDDELREVDDITEAYGAEEEVEEREGIVVRPAYGERKSEGRGERKRVLYQREKREEVERKRELDEFRKDVKRGFEEIRKEFQAFRKEFINWQKSFKGMSKFVDELKSSFKRRGKEEEDVSYIAELLEEWYEKGDKDLKDLKKLVKWIKEERRWYYGEDYGTGRFYRTRRGIARVFGEIYKDFVRIGFGGVFGPLAEVFEDVIKGFAEDTKDVAKRGLKRVKEGVVEGVRGLFACVKEVVGKEKRVVKEITESVLAEAEARVEAARRKGEELLRQIREGLEVAKEKVTESFFVPQLQVVGVSELVAEDLKAKQLTVKVDKLAKIEFEGIRGIEEREGIVRDILEGLGIGAGMRGAGGVLKGASRVAGRLLLPLAVGLGVVDLVRAFRRGGLSAVFFGEKGENFISRIFGGTAKGLGLGAIVGGGIGGLIGGIPGAIAGAKVGGMIGSLIVGAMNVFGEQLRGLFGGIEEGISAVIGSLGRIFDVLKKGLGEIEGVLRTIADAIMRVFKFFGDLFGELKDEAEKKGEDVLNWLKRMFRGIDLGQMLKNIESIAIWREVSMTPEQAKTEKGLTKVGFGKYLGPFQMTKQTFEVFAKRYGYWERLKKYEWLSSDFMEEWRKIIREQSPGKIYEQMKEFMIETHYFPMLRNLGRLGQELLQKGSQTLNEVLFDISVRYGQKLGAKVVEEALRGIDVSKAGVDEIIRRIYERAKAGLPKDFEKFYKEVERKKGLKAKVEAIESAQKQISEIESMALDMYKKEQEEKKKEEEEKRKKAINLFKSLGEKLEKKIQRKEDVDLFKRLSGKLEEGIQRKEDVDLFKRLSGKLGKEETVFIPEGSIKEVKFVDLADAIDRIVDKSSEIEAMKAVVIERRAEGEEEKGTRVAVSPAIGGFEQVPTMVDDLVVLMMQLGLLA